MKRLITQACTIWITALLLGCGTADDASFGSMDFAVGDKSPIISALDAAVSSVDVAVYSLVDLQLVAALNRAANRNVKVRVLLDESNHDDILNIQHPGIPAKSGNLNGGMQANFILIDNRTVLLLSSSLIEEERFIMLELTDEHLAHDFYKEFNQMYTLGNHGVGNGDYDRKTLLSYNLQYRIAGNIIEVYFLPQDKPLERLYSQLAKTQASLHLYAGFINNNKFYTLFTEMADAGIACTVRLGSQSTAKSPLYQNWLLNDTLDAAVLSDPLHFNAGSADTGRQTQSFFMTSFPLEQNSPTLHSDGVLIIIRGPEATRLDTAVRSFIAGSPAQSLSPSAVTVRKPGYRDVVFHEIGFMRIGNEWLGDFVELKNISTDFIDLTGHTLVITNNNRLSEPNFFTMPSGTVLSPGGFYVIAGDADVYSYIDFVWHDMFVMSSGFMYALVDAGSELIDRAGDLNNGMGGFSGLGGTINANGTDVSITRRTSPVGDGTLAAQWFNTATAININSAYTGEITATPGAN